VTQNCNRVDATIISKYVTQANAIRKYQLLVGSIRTVTGETFVSKSMVNVNAHHKEGFYYFYLW